MDWVLFSAELDITKMLVPRLPQDALDVNVECDGKAKQLYSLCDQPLGAPICLFFIILILTCYSLILPDVNYGIYGWSSSKTTQGVSLYRKLTMEEKNCCSYYTRYSDRWKLEKAN